MRYQKLKDFLQYELRMSHIYQPVMIKELLDNYGVFHERDISKSLLMNDETQIDYYTKFTNAKVGRVLRNHGIVLRDRKTKEYRLKDIEYFSSAQIRILKDLCDMRINNFLETRRKMIFNRGERTIGRFSGAQRYEVLKRAKYHCELCGIPADKKALEV